MIKSGFFFNATKLYNLNQIKRNITVVIILLYCIFFKYGVIQYNNNNNNFKILLIIFVFVF